MIANGKANKNLVYDAPRVVSWEAAFFEEQNGDSGKKSPKDGYQYPWLNHKQSRYSNFSLALISIFIGHLDLQTALSIL